MRLLLLSVAVIVSVVVGGAVPATATPLATPGLSRQSTKATLAEEVGWRRHFRRYGYPVPYAYYPPAYGYYAPPPAYAYYPPAYESYAPPPVAAEGDYSPADEYADSPPPTEEYGDYPPAEGY
jgi:hypothetical protein